MTRIAIVTPLFPTSSEPYRGRPVYQTVLELQRLVDLDVFYPQVRYPRWRFLRPRNWLYQPGDPNYSPPGVKVRYIEYPALPVLTRPISNNICAHYLRPVLKKAAADLILAYWLYPEGYVALSIGEELGIPVVLGARGSDLLQISDRVILRKVKRALRRASFVLTVSDGMRRRALEFGVAPECVRTIHNGCDASLFKPADRAAARAERGVPPDAQLVLFVGRLIPLKGHQELFEALARLVPSHPRLELALIGEGLMEGALRARAARPDLAGHVRFLGVRPAAEVARWLAAANLFCLPSHSEGCPNVVLEALSCGRPIVASRVGGVPELVDPSCAILVPPRDSEQLAQALAQALRHPWDEAAIAARFSRGWKQVAQETYQVCLQVLEKSGCGQDAGSQ